MDDIEFEVHGLVQLERKFVALGKKAGAKTLRQSLMFATTPTLKLAKARAPFDASKYGDKGGHIRDALGRSTKFLRTHAVSLKLGEAVTRSKKFEGYIKHGIAIEMGTRRAAAQPFLRPALEETTGTIISRFQKHFRQALLGK